MTRSVLVDEIKARMTQALRDKDPVVKDVLGVALGEIQTAEARANRALGDDEAFAVLRKLVKSNEETLALASDDANAPTLRREIEVLSALLPRAMTAEAIAAALAPVADQVRAARSDGQAMGVAMKHLKAGGAVVDAAAVQQAVKHLRT